MNNFGNVSSGASGFDPYGNKKYLQGSQNFLKSNSIVAKLAFLLLVIFIFLILLQLGAVILARIFTFSSSPVLVDGMVDGERLMVIPQNPGSPNAIPIVRSTNQRDGLVFTWSFWLYVKQPGMPNAACTDCLTGDGGGGAYNHVFSKGNDNIGPDGVMTPNNAPGVYVSSDRTRLMIVMSTFANPREEVVIAGIPIENWMNVIIRQNQHRIDIFINGTLTRSMILKSVPNQNYDPVYIGLNGGFQGNLASLQYFASAIGANKIQQIVSAGPNTKVLDGTSFDGDANYLSLRWFFPQYSTGQINK